MGLQGPGIVEAGESLGRRLWTARMIDARAPADGLDKWRHWFCALLVSKAKGGALEQVDDGDMYNLWEHDNKAREVMRPTVVEYADIAQFLADKRLTLDPSSHTMFADSLFRDLFAAMTLVSRRARGDDGTDKWADQFPRREATADAALTAWVLFERWVAEAKPAASTVNRWRTVFLKLQSDFPNTAAAALLPEQMQRWAEGLISKERSPVTVRDVWVIACRTVFAWAIDKNLVARNPFTGWRITVPRRVSTRETKAFTDEESNAILKAALAIDARTKGDAAKRWTPWLAAYSGARMGEITQLRGADVVGNAFKISPEAGTVKNRKPRTVPLHEHLIEQGFLDFVKASGPGPLFYNEQEQAAASDPTNPRKAQYVKARDQVAKWVRSLGINDPELSPNHAWRHTFKAIAFRCGMSEKIIDAIVGHAPASVGRAYGEPTLADKAVALSKFPRYKV